MKSNIDYHPFQDITTLGGLAFYTLLTLFILTLGLTTIALKLVIGFIITYGISLLIRLLYFKKRPNNQKYKTIIERLDASSFPSIHAARITFLGLFFIILLDSIYTTILLLIIILLVCYSRHHLKKHDIKDLLAGIILGIGTWSISMLF